MNTGVEVFPTSPEGHVLDVSTGRSFFNFPAQYVSIYGGLGYCAF